MFNKKEKITSSMLAPVQQTWLFKLPWKMQTVVNQALRAPDTHFCPKIKIVCRWMRSVVLHNADNTHSFMCRKEKLPTWEDIENELNYCSVHFASHFLYGLEIIGYKHTDVQVRADAMNLYCNVVVNSMHLNVEKESDLDNRLRDMEDVPKLSEVFDITPAAPTLCPQNDRYIRR